MTSLRIVDIPGQPNSNINPAPDTLNAFIMDNLNKSYSLNASKRLDDQMLSLLYKMKRNGMNKYNKMNLYRSTNYIFKKNLNVSNRNDIKILKYTPILNKLMNAGNSVSEVNNINSKDKNVLFSISNIPQNLEKWENIENSKLTTPYSKNINENNFLNRKRNVEQELNFDIIKKIKSEQELLEEGAIKNKHKLEILKKSTDILNINKKDEQLNNNSSNNFLKNIPFQLDVSDLKNKKYKYLNENNNSDYNDHSNNSKSKNDDAQPKNFHLNMNITNIKIKNEKPSGKKLISRQIFKCDREEKIINELRDGLRRRNIVFYEEHYQQNFSIKFKIIDDLGWVDFRTFKITVENDTWKIIDYQKFKGDNLIISINNADESACNIIMEELCKLKTELDTS